MKNNEFNWFSDLISPIGVALVTLIFTAVYRILQEKNFSKNKKINVLDNLIISFNTAVEKLEQLKVDATSDLFKYENRNTAERVAKRLQELAYQTEVLTDSGLRRTILEYTDEYLSLIEDINGLEMYANDKYNKFNDKKKISLDELRAFKFEVIKIGYEFKNSELVSLNNLHDSSINSAVEIALKEVYLDLESTFTEARNELNNANDFSKDRRVHLAIRIVDTQTKLRELSAKLQVSRDELVTKWYKS